jgi:hypothetical protein
MLNILEANIDKACGALQVSLKMSWCYTIEDPFNNYKDMLRFYPSCQSKIQHGFVGAVRQHTEQTDPLPSESPQTHHLLSGNKNDDIVYPNMQ